MKDTFYVQHTRDKVSDFNGLSKQRWSCNARISLVSSSRLPKLKAATAGVHQSAAVHLGEAMKLWTRHHHIVVEVNSLPNTTQSMISLLGRSEDSRVDCVGVPIPITLVGVGMARAALA